MTRSPTVAHERPILFSAPMVRAILDGRKTQTRRVLKPQPVLHPSGSWRWEDRHGGAMGTNVESFPDIACHWSRYQPGDHLWVRESIGRRTASFLGIEATNGVEEAYYLADDEDVVNEHGFNLCPWWERGTLPSIHMPRWASRITLEVTEARVQRLQDISEEDAMAEVATNRPHCSGFRDAYSGWSMDWSQVGRPSRFARDGKRLSESDVSLGSAVSAFASFVNELHDPKWNLRGDGIFGANPWVTAITFRRIDQAGGGHG